MTRFNTLDHFMLSGTLFNTCVDGTSVIHDVVNTSDHDPIFLRLHLDVKYIGLAKRVFMSRASWAKAVDADLIKYRASLSNCLSDLSIPSDAILCSNPKCNCSEHFNLINQYADNITKACLAASESSIPHTTDRQSGKRIPGWTERVEPLRQKSVFWHGLWVECERPHNGAVADVMRRTRAAYHYAIRQARRDEDSIVRERLAE